MDGPTDDAKSSGTESAATASPRGTDGNTVSYRMTCIDPEQAPTLQRIQSGRAKRVTGSDTPARNFRLSDEEQQEWFRLWRIRKRGQMLTMGECDWLLEMVGRMARE